jgi:putative transposase
MRKTYKYRLYPTTAQATALEAQLGEACRLYNAALQERREAYRLTGTSVNYYDQANQLKAIREDDACGLANFSASQDVLRRVDKTFKAFFRRVHAGAEKPGYPRFKSRRRFDSYTFPSWGDGCRLTDADRLYLQGVGHLKVKWHRPLEGTIKTVTVKRQAGKWFACFSVEYVADALPVLDARIGIDVGLTSFATLSTGETIANPRHYRKAQKKLRIAQRRVARRKRGGRNRRKAVVVLQKAHAHVQNQRAGFHHKAARELVNTYGVIAVEALNIKGLASGMLAKSVNDAGWSAFINTLDYKAAEAGRQVVYVNPRGTSQTCLCGAPVPKTLSQRWHECVECGLSAARDHVSAQLILGLGLSLLGLT